MSDRSLENDLRPLPREDRCTALRLARQSIVAALDGTPVPPAAGLRGALLERCGAFVTVYHRGALRGCVGTIDPEAGFALVLPRLARAAAFEDHRFAPLRSSEMTAVTIEISRLSPLRPARLEEIDVGLHGVCIEVHGRRGVFLPKVAAQHGWTRDELLAALCRKADLAESAWSSAAAQLLIFRAEVFADDNLTP